MTRRLWLITAAAVLCLGTPGCLQEEDTPPRGDIEALEQHNARLAAEARGLAEDLERVRAERDNCRMQCDQLKLTLADKGEQVEVLRRDLQAAREAQQGLEDTVAKLTAQVEVLHRDHQAARDAQQKVEVSIAKLTAEVAALRESVEALRKKSE